MILWIIKQLLSLHQAVMGRARPSELAWGLAIGVGIGLIPKGNLVSLMLIGLLVSLRVNHGIAALAAVGCSFLAGRLDPWTHELGVVVLGAEQVRTFLERVWNWPLMPWTDLNNTVVMGSTLLATAALLPTYAVSLPLFRWLAPRIEQGAGIGDPPPAEAASLAVVERSSTAAEAPQAIEHAGTGAAALAAAASPLGDSGDEPIAALLVPPEIQQETHIDIIRFKTPANEADRPTADVDPVSGGQMNEALGYLLRRLRDSRQGKAA